MVPKSWSWKLGSEISQDWSKSINLINGFSDWKFLTKTLSKKEHSTKSFSFCCCYQISDHNELFGSGVKHVQLKRLEPLLIELENLGVFLYSDKIFGDCLRIFPARIQCRLYFYATKLELVRGKRKTDTENLYFRVKKLTIYFIVFFNFKI